MKKLLVGLVVLTGLVGGLPMIGAYVMAKKMRAERAEQRAAVDNGAAIAAFIADHAALRDHWLNKTYPGADASAALMPRVAFRGRGLSREAKLGVPQAVDDRLREVSREWIDHIDDIDLDGVDIAWMSELPRYGYWDLEVAGSPMNIDPWFYPEAPIPDFISLQTLHRVRLLLGLKSGDLGPALIEARALARLCASTELLIGDLFAVAMAGDERTAIEAARARGIDVDAVIAAADFAVDDEATVDRYKRACFATSMAYRLDEVSPGLADHVHICRCSGLQEGIAGADMLRAFASDRYASRYQALESQLSSSNCRLKNARAGFATGKSRDAIENLRTLCNMSAGLNDDPICSAPGVVARMPLMREAIGEVLLSIGEPDWLARYREAPSTSP